MIDRLIHIRKLRCLWIIRALRNRRARQLWDAHLLIDKLIDWQVQLNQAIIEYDKCLRDEIQKIN